MKLKLQNSLDYNWTWKGFPINQNQPCQKWPDFLDNSSRYKIEIGFLQNSKALKSFSLNHLPFYLIKISILNFDQFFFGWGRQVPTPNLAFRK